MGNRVKGRTKKKSIKAASHSGMGSKRKLSRMGKKQKKDHAGLDATFIGRSQCLKKLQVTLKDFRRLCILKGIYPRQPLGKVPKNKKGQTFYHIKDIKAIAHEPVLEKFREFRAFMKKIRRAAGRNERDEAARKNSIVPTYTLHHLVKERYPRFVDALSDIDDALTLVYLFAALPSENTIKAKVTNKAKSLAAAWGAYCATTFSITKSFISVKGVYLEASIRGTIIRWVVPHSFTQFLPEDVDYKVMQTFFEFYETLLDFVLFKLYNDIGVRYPLPVDHPSKMMAGSKSALLGANLHSLKHALNSSSGAISDAVTKSVEKSSKDMAAAEVDEKGKTTTKKSKELIKSVGVALSKVDGEDSDGGEDDMDDDDEDNTDVAGPLKVALESLAEEEDRTAVPGAKGEEAELDDDARKRKHLFAGLTFFLSREIPRGYLELVCLAYGGSVGWEGDDSPITAKDSKITHHIVDRPKLPSSYNGFPKSREFIQPQWIIDCANFMFILPVAKYSVGVTLPPHLSPWVDDEEEGYKPAYAEEVERLKNGESMEDIEATAEDSDSEEEETDPKKEGSDEESEDDSDDDKKDEKSSEAGKAKHEDDDGDDESSEECEEEDDEASENRKKKKRKKEEDEAHDLAKVMMSRKASRLYGRMQRGIAQKKADVDSLHKRRKELEKESKKKQKSAEDASSRSATKKLKKSKSKSN